MSRFEQETQQILDSLRTAVAKDLERKRRLGQHYVVWRDGRPVRVGIDVPYDSGDDAMILNEGANAPSGESGG